MKKRTEIKPTSTDRFILLESVGTFIDPDTLITYPCKTDRTPDLDSPVMISEVSNEWIQKLSKTDYKTILEL